MTNLANAWHSGDGATGVLLCHGFTGSPASMRPWGDDLVAAGHRVAIPLLPGHGTSWRDMNSTVWRQWYQCVDDAFTQLRRDCDRVVIGGLSMGGALTLRLAEQHGDDVAGIMLVNPAVQLKNPLLIVLPLLKRVVGSVGAIGNDIAQPGADEQAYDRTPLRALASLLELFADVRAGLDRVTQPVLFFRSVNDHVVNATSSEILFSHIASTDVTAHLLTRSYHVATLDYDAPVIFSHARTFVERVGA